MQRHIFPARFLGVLSAGMVSLTLCALPKTAVAEEIPINEFSRFAGGATSNEFGSAVSAAGDVNGDGYDDFLVGDTFDSENGSQAGAAYLIYGQQEQFDSSDDIDLTDAMKLSGAAAGDQAGFAVAGGDINADGYADILIGAPGNDSSTGAVYLIYGQAEALSAMNLSSAITFTGMAESDSFGRSIAVVGDTNGDTFADFLIGAPYHDNDSTGEVNAGAAYVVLGSATAFISGSIFGVGDKIMAEQISAYAGFAVSGAGDVNDDGYGDMLVGAPGDASGDGVAYLVLGQSISYQQTFSALMDLGNAYMFTGVGGEYAGVSVSGAGDVNNDGNADMLVGASLNAVSSDDAGAAYLVYGAVSYPSSTVDIADYAVQYTGVAADDSAGSAVAGVGDVNNDGYSDVLIGAPAYDASEEMQDAGVAYFIIGGSNLPAAQTTVSLADAAVYTIVGEQAGQAAGESLSSAGDVDNDGYVEVLVGSTDYDSSGAMYVGYFNDSSDDNDEDETEDSEEESSVEIADDEVDNDGDGEVDEVNTVAENGYHPDYGYLDVTDADIFSVAISSFAGGKNGKITVTFADNSVYRYKIFDINTDKKTVVKQYKNTGFLIVLQPSGKKMSLVNPFAGIVASTVTLSKDTGYKKNAIQQYNLRKDKDDAIEIIVTSTKDNQARVSIVKVDLSSHELNKKDSQTLSSTAVDIKNTEVKSKQITLRSSSDTDIQAYTVNKKYQLIQ